MKVYRFYKSRFASPRGVWRYTDDGPVGEISTDNGHTWRPAAMPEDIWYEDERVEYPDGSWQESSG